MLIASLNYSRNYSQSNYLFAVLFDHSLAGNNPLAIVFRTFDEEFVVRITFRRNRDYAGLRLRVVR